MRAPQGRKRGSRKAESIPLHVGLPVKRVIAKFNEVYELEGAQKAINLLTRYYHVRKLRIVLDGRRVPRQCCAVYFEDTAYFRREGLRRRVVLHEAYHFFVEAQGYDLGSCTEEKEANAFASRFLKS